jgi:hypothetical protein
MLVENGFPTFSPLSHGAALLDTGASDEITFWDAVNFPILRRSTVFLILPLPGWQHSDGIRRELIEWMEHCTTPATVTFVIPHGVYWQVVGEDYQVSLPRLLPVKLTRTAETPDLVMFSAPAADILASMHTSTGDKNDLPL